MNKITPSWMQLFRANYIDNYVCLVIKAYQSIGNDSHIVRKKEEERRTELVEAMRDKKEEFHINQPFGRYASAQIEMKVCRQAAAFLVKFVQGECTLQRTGR